MRKNDYVIIMAGGIGSRFWPMSRTDFPKQFHDILGTGKSLIRMTFERFSGFLPDKNIFVVTNQAYKGLVEEHLPELPESNILLEPVGRNTAPCVAYACGKINKVNPEATVFVAASDHLITNEGKFLRIAGKAMDICREEEIIMTLGITPTRPDTGYGYIQYFDEDPLPSQGLPENYYKVKTFTEKPALEVAQTFLESGDFLWNSGMFVFSVKTILNSFKEHLLDMYELFAEISDSYYTEGEIEAIRDVYDRSRNISIDNGIMEKAQNVYVIPSSFGWSDLGTWGSLYEHMDKDYLGNAVQGKAMIFEAANNVLRVTDKKKLVVLHGLNDHIVVDTDDVLMICKKEDEQRIKEIVADVRKLQDGNYA